MPEKGFTATFVSNSGKKPRQISVSGWKLYIARILIALFVLLVSASVLIVAYGLINSGESERLRAEILNLQDSLAVRKNIEVRLDSMENEIQQLHEFRQRLENVASIVSASDDTLQQ